MIIAHIQEELSCGLCSSSLRANAGGAEPGAQLCWSASPTGAGAVLCQPRALLCAGQGRAALRHQQDSTKPPLLWDSLLSVVDLPLNQFRAPGEK